VAQNTQTPPTGDNVAGSAIFKKFLSTAEGYIKQPTRMKQLLTDAYKKASEKNDVGTLAHEAWETLQTMFRLIKASMSGEYTGVPGTTVAAAVAVLIYFLSPIDLIPDFIPVLGLLDDVALVAWFSTTLKTEMDKFQEWENSTARVVSASGLNTGAYAATDKETSATTADTASTATATASNEEKHAADALDEQAAAATSPRETGTGTTALSDRAVPAKESAKQHGTTDLPGAPAVGGQSATDSGLGSPESSSPRPVHEAGPDVQPSGPTNGPTVRTWEGSRNGNDPGALDAGGNVR
jgi:uncharacterized membrane protein YkvA (DUF1232 family)